MRQLLCLLPLLLHGCSDPADRAPERRGPPPPVATSTVVSCTREAIEDATSKAFFPAKSGDFCLDPAEPGKAMGEGAKQPLEAMCDLFDGECKVYENHGVQRVVSLRYVAPGGKTIDINLSRFASGRAAYAMFTKRTVGDGDPADPAAPAPFELASGAAALGAGNANAVRGTHLIELTYSDPQATPAALEAASKTTLGPLLSEIAKRIPAADAPAELGLLEAEHRLPVGVRVLLSDAIATTKLAGTQGYYAADGKRWRLVVAEAPVEETEAAYAALAKAAGADKAAATVALTTKDPQGDVGWLVARRGGRLFAVADEPRVLRSGATAEERAKVFLSEAEKATRLEAWLKRVAP